jgi:glycosyltransferase involved in cell wall biosynthesis
MRSKVTVIIPTYNRALMVEKACVSVLNQTYKDFEVFVVDNGSTDNTERAISNLNDSRVRYIRMSQPTDGPAGPRNHGIRISDSPYLAFLDSDDQWLDDKLTLQMALFEGRERLGLVYSDGFITRNSSKTKRVKDLKMLHRGNITTHLIKGNFMPLSSVVARRECFQECGAFNEKFFSAADWELWLRCVERFEVDYVDRPLIKYLIHEGAHSRDHITMFDEVIEVLQMVKKRGFWQKKGLRELVEKEICFNRARRELFLGYAYILEGKDGEGKKAIYNVLTKANMLNNKWKFYSMISYVSPPSLLRKILAKVW